MGLKILCAGGSKEEKEAVETAVRAGIGSRPPGETWTVSLVKIGRQWSVTLDGPEKTSPRSTFMAAEGGLRAAVSDSMARRGGPARGAAAMVPAVGALSKSAGAPGEHRNRYTCAKCGKGFVVAYDVEAGEGEETVPAACPHCWQIEDVKVGATAAVNNDYRVEKS
jgi:DNA-directed RNA polymerase subunit RPC12/RpoP